jgi:hypothetical protein
MMRVFTQSVTLAIVVATCSWTAAHSAVVAQYNLGEDDGGLTFDGFPGADPTVDSVGSNDLIKLGDALYSSDTPGPSSTVSMAYDGAGDYYYGAAPTRELAFPIHYSFDAKMNAAGANGFSFLASLGSNTGGISVVEIGGKIRIFFPGAGGGSGEFTPTLNQWHHYEVDYSYNAGSPVTTLTVDGNVVSTRNGLPANSQITDALTLGGNYRLNVPALAAARTTADFEGSFNGRIDNFVMSQVPEPATAGLVGVGVVALGLLVRRRA